jgi:glycosyltransferase XagB
VTYPFEPEPPATVVAETQTDRRLGAILIEHGIIDEQQLAEALEVHSRTSSRLGQVMLSRNMVTPRQLYTALAALWGADYVEVESDHLDDELLTRVDLDQVLREGWVPMRRNADGVIEVLTSRRPTMTMRDRVEIQLGEPVDLKVSSDWEVSRAIQLGYRDTVVDRATLQLWRDDESASARTVLDTPQKIVGIVILLALIAAFVLEPRMSVAITSLVISAAFLIGIAFKFVMCMAGARREFEAVVTDEEVAALSDDDLPVYTVLVPCYKESEIVSQLVTNLGALDYPLDKLEILLLLEADDAETLDAAKASNPPRTVTIVVTPDGQPRTKPKACNVGLMLARGQYLVIYDAEDRPDPDQLKKAVVGFRKARPGTVCLQAALNYFNADENLLTRMFTLEYSFWFDYMLSGLDARNMPIPLGGTSNHFVTQALRELGGWDPFNVTEDADLGIRASARGQRVGVINSTTFEEANNAYGNWIRQRSRWIKGYMQTTLVHLRRPVRLVRTAGLRQALAFALLIGGTAASFLAVIPLYIVFAVSLALSPDQLSRYFPGWVLWFSLINLLLGNGLMIWVSMMGAFRRKRYWLVLWALLNPLYWLMHSISAYKALYQLITRPHYWEKTTHGLTHVGPAAAE